MDPEIPPPENLDPEPPVTENLLESLAVAGEYEKFDTGNILDLFVESYGGTQRFIKDLIKDFQSSKVGSTARIRVQLMFMTIFLKRAEREEALRNNLDNMEDGEIEANIAEILARNPKMFKLIAKKLGKRSKVCFACDRKL